MFGNKEKQVEAAIAGKKAGKLIKLAQEKDAAVALSAIRGLGQVGGEDAVNFLITQLRSADAHVRAAAAEGLGATGDIHAKAHVSGAMKNEKDPDALQAMRNALTKISDY